jgi:hypothetical protein
MDDGSWIWWVLAGLAAVAFWPSPEDREIRRQIRKLEMAKRERERLVSEIERRDRGVERSPGDWP